MDGSGLTTALDRSDDAIELAILSHLKYSLGKPWESATITDLYKSLAHTVRDLAIDVMLETDQRYRREDVKMVHYLSMEFLIGRSLSNNLINLGVYQVCKDAIARLGYDLDEVREQEADPALGNGGLGRLAACFLDSMATIGIPGYGYGINYEFGLFKQEFENGYQVERPDQWLATGSPWLIERPDNRITVPIRGRVVGQGGGHDYDPMWMEWQALVGVPYDLPIAGYGGHTVNRLRLYAARASDEFDIRIFNQGDYTRAVEGKVRSETISKILYPSDSGRSGQELRLTQEYFLVACALRDIVRRYKRAHHTMDAFADKNAIQLNDTHPALAIAELMRILVDEEAVPWIQAWPITTHTFGFTNHTLMAEAMETWPVSLVAHLLPRHLQIIEEINRRFLESDATPVLKDDPAALARVSLIDDAGERRVRMANLAVVGSHAVNGVAKIHSRLLTETTFRDFCRIWPERFTNVTNGITPRRWLLEANPRLAAAITDRIGDAWITDLNRLTDLHPFAADLDLQEEFAAIKHANKVALAETVDDLTRVVVDPTTLFDVQAKRLHEYKRQLLNALHIIHLYLGLVGSPGKEITPRVFIFAAKAAPGYWMAKLIIKLINNIARVVNADPAVRGQLKVAFIPDYRVSLAERIIPAANLSEQISTAGKEASGTGNMKLALNGALTIGTLDGANVEIAEAVGPENIYIFGNTVEDLAALRAAGYHPRALYDADPRIHRVIGAIQSDIFSKDEPGLFQPIVDSLLNHDEYFLLADFAAYVETQERVAVDFLDKPAWTRRAILNVAGMGPFSSDRAITDYARTIWHVHPAAAD
ncbi:MAG: glycogen/starch/alpha-glucan phosphorylase [Dehalococcoidia bacterium]